MSKCYDIIQKKGYQIVASLAATIVVISDGMQYGWSSPMIPFLHSEKSHIKISPEDETWLELTYFIGALIALPSTVILADRLGRRKTILLCSSVSVITWILIAIAKNVVWLHVARVLSGVASDLVFVVVPMYCSEIADQHIRGFLTGLVYIMFWIGLILIYATGPFVPFYVPSVIIIALLVIQIVMFSLMPESPYFLISQGNGEAAKKALRKLRQTENVENEYETIANSIKMQKEDRSGLKKLIFKKSTIKAFAIVTILNTFQLFSGFGVMLMNIHSILDGTESIYIDSSYSSVIFAILTIISISICAVSIDKFGRKIFLISSSFLTGFCLLILAVYFNLKKADFDTSFYSWVPVVCVFTFAVTFNIGLGMVPKIMASELFSSEIKAIGMSYGDGIYVIMGSLSILFYKTFALDDSMHIPFYGFAGMTFLTIIFTVSIIPETKGKSLQEIQVMLEK